MTTVNVSSVDNTIVVTENGSTTVVQVPQTTVVSALTAGPKGMDGPPKSLTIAYPVSGDNLTLFYTEGITNLLRVAAVIRGTGSPSVTYVLKYASNRSAVGTSATASTTASSTTTASTATIQNMPIPADVFLWLEITAISGNPTELNITVSV
jgi:hypothetical protein